MILEPIPVLLCIDVEPELVLPDPRRPEPWFGYERVHKYLSQLRSVITESTGSPAHYCWYLRMDPQIAAAYGHANWVIGFYSRQLDEICREGDEVGVHPHLHRWLPEEQDWLLDLTDQDWIDHCLHTSVETYRSTFGRDCRSVRFGFWLNHRTVELMDRLGVKVDLSLVPGQRPTKRFDPGGRLAGWYPSYFRVPREPYYPARRDFRCPDAKDKMKILMIPLSVARIEGFVSIRSQLRRMLSFAGTGFQRWEHALQLSMTHQWSCPNSFADLLDRHLSSAAGRYVALVIRTECGSNPALFNKLQDAMRTLLNHPLRRRFVFTTPENAAKVLAAPGGTQTGALLSEEQIG